MRTRDKAAVSTASVALLLALSAPAAHASQYWFSKTTPSNVRSNSGTVLGQAYGRAYNTTQNVNSNATYHWKSGNYGIYVSSDFSFYRYNADTKITEWVWDSWGNSPTNSSTSWKTNTKTDRLHSSASQSRVSVKPCTDVPFLVPGNCAGTNILTNSY